MTRPSALFYAIIGTVIYVFILIVLHGELSEFPGDAVSRLNLNLLGDSIGGLTAPVALIWLIAAVITQRQELNLTKEELAKTANAMKDQVFAANEQIALSEASAQANWRLSLFDKRISIYNDLKDLSRVLGSNGQIDADFMVKVGNVSNRIKFVFGADIQAWVKKIQDDIDTYFTREAEYNYFVQKRTFGGLLSIDEAQMAEALLAFREIEREISRNLEWSLIEEKLDMHLILPERISLLRYMRT